MIDHYDWSGGREAMLRFGPDTGPVVMIALPLFEEANRTRTFAVTLCRALAKRGVSSVLPDMPGQGESLVATERLGLNRTRSAFAHLAVQLSYEDRRVYSASVRSGALLEIDARLAGRWRLSPQPTYDLLRDLEKIKRLAKPSAERTEIPSLFLMDEAGSSFEIAGNMVSADFIGELYADRHRDSAAGARVRTVRLDTDRKPADRHVPGTPLWRRAEPGNDPALAVLLAYDIADWIAVCERC